MSKLTTLSGVVSGLRVDSNVTVNTTVSAETGATSTSTSKTTTVNFRIDNRPAYMNVPVNLNNGDIVTAAGIQRGEFETIAIHNHTTKTLYSLPKPPFVVISIVAFMVVILTVWIPVWGLISLAIGIYYVVDAYLKKQRINEAWKIVEKAPMPSGK
jgi:hypothetical protein